MNIYKTTNLTNNKIYIGQEIKFHENYYGSGIKIKRAIRKYGKENFSKEIICVCENKEELDQQEKFFIRKYNATNKDVGYNIAEGGEGGALFKNHHHTEEIRRKLSKHRKTIVGSLTSMYGKHHSEETKKKMSENKKGKFGELNGMYGKTHTEESKNKMGRDTSGKANGMYGKTQSEECKSQIRQKMLGEGNPFFGKKHSEETKRKMSDAKRKIKTNT